MRLAGIILLIFMATLLPAQSTWALSCVEQPTIEEAYEKYDGVVVGQVEQVKRVGEQKLVELSILHSYKGITTTKLLMKEDATWGTSEPSRTYLFFLNQENGKWQHPLCSPTKPAVDASEEMTFLADKEIEQLVAPSSDVANSFSGRIIILCLAAATVLALGVVLIIRIRSSHH